MYGVTTQSTAIHIFNVQKKTEFHAKEIYSRVETVREYLESSGMWRRVVRQV
jgi:hypothetical protein